MTVKKKASSKTETDLQASEMINRGGKPTAQANINEEVRFTLRIPRDMIDQIDSARKQRVGTISRNTFILEAINDWLGHQP